jgi:hypothetical protein
MTSRGFLARASKQDTKYQYVDISGVLRHLPDTPYPTTTMTGGRRRSFYGSLSQILENRWAGIEDERSKYMRGTPLSPPSFDKEPWPRKTAPWNSNGEPLSTVEMYSVLYYIADLPFTSTVFSNGHAV